MSRIILLLSLSFLFNFANAIAGGCGPAIIVTNNKIQKKFNFEKLTDTIHVALDPADSTLTLWLYINGHSCDFSDGKWFKNGVRIATGLECITAGKGIYEVKALFDNHPFDVVIIVDDMVTDVDEVNADPAKQLTIYPNPSFIGLYTLKRQKVSEPYAISIYTLDGKLVKEMQMKLDEMILEISDFPKGVYLLEWTSENGTKGSQKFIYN
jgi:hypothetical protein